jgi:addiction module RelE/StbE family toxin
MREVTWAPRAIDDVVEITTWIRVDNPAAAEKTAERIVDLVKSLAYMPVGRKSRMKGLYEMVVPGLPYIITYEYDPLTLHVLRVIHGARHWPEGEWPA